MHLKKKILGIKNNLFLSLNGFVILILFSMNNVFCAESALSILSRESKFVNGFRCHHTRRDNFDTEGLERIILRKPGSVVVDNRGVPYTITAITAAFRIPRDRRVFSQPSVVEGDLTNKDLQDIVRYRNLKLRNYKVLEKRRLKQELIDRQRRLERLALRQKQELERLAIKKKSLEKRVSDRRKELEDKTEMAELVSRIEAEGIAIRRKIVLQNNASRSCTIL